MKAQRYWWWGSWQTLERGTEAGRKGMGVTATVWGPSSVCGHAHPPKEQLCAQDRAVTVSQHCVPSSAMENKPEGLPKNGCNPGGSSTV